ncbi:hydrogenase-4 component B [Thermodesulfobium acidiphilum]|uniref:Hydrogenase-4 component B n=1 Tax=Thermodesulfobium acidiphilum TaxID=1794699 RepID=A0A2R4W0W5_THEAF|nr:proton-conducting transporter membrane subunit [Thermodesulfobium acidiphilum]AWB10354.1 hydrogenase-4 component B [Thermodesulfobium acidiphilum]
MIDLGFILFYLSVGFYILGAIVPLAFSKNKTLSLKIGSYFGLTASVLGFMSGVFIFLLPNPILFNLLVIAPNIELQFYFDKLSAFFLLILSTINFLIMIYSLEYMKSYLNDNIAKFSFFYNLFICSMSVLFLVSNSITFLIFWELMSIFSYFLVTFEYRHQHVRKAGFFYIFMTHFGTVFIISGLLYWGTFSNGLNFDAMKIAAMHMSMFSKSIIFLCFLIGFGTKAGIVPLHIWLPMAHPSAPSNVSAMMSSVMIKTAIYGIFRFVIDMLGVGPIWWGSIILFIGIASSLIGVLYALMEHDIKKLLAYHSVENIGIIFMGVGLGVIFSSMSLYTFAAIAYCASLFHVLNHAVFKSLLFLSAGSISKIIGTRDMEHYGGLIKNMPKTALSFLIGSLAISAIPPLNGFASEYQIYISMLNLSYFAHSYWKLFAILSPVALILTGALAAACFVKAFSVSFLALPRSSEAKNAKEPNLMIILPEAILAFSCILLGLLASNILFYISKIVLQIDSNFNVVYFQTTNLLFFIIFGIFFSLSIIFGKIFGLFEIRKVPTWGCGINLNSKMEYTAASFSQPIRRTYSFFLRPNRKITVNPSKPLDILFSEDLKPPFTTYLYSPIRKFILNFSIKMRFLQSGYVHFYLAYIFITLVVLLLWYR